MQKETRTLPGPAHAVPLLEALATDKGSAVPR
jgi:hypothetical protein